ncbi:MAG: class I SAM-dependent rRNA methyltransferase [Ignavibacteria bacterium]
MAKIYLRRNEEHRIKNGHLWAFSNEVFKLEGEAESGDMVDIYDSRENYIGTGFYNKNSLITFRLLSRKPVKDLGAFIISSIQKAYELRKAFYPGRNSYRLVFSESDFLPGLIVDKYNDTCVLQVCSVGMERNIELIVKALKEVTGAVNIFSRNEHFFRKTEGLPEEDRIYAGAVRSEIISDGAVKYKINFEKGHKTGFYFDQGDNRTFIEKISNGKTVLDAFCNSGGFGLHATLAGATDVLFLDSSASEIQNAMDNFILNDLNAKVEYVVADVFDHFEKLISENRKFDVVMTDPPAFAKNKKSLPVAKKGYEKLNRLALKLVNDGGFLVTSSCSHHLLRGDFLDIINVAAYKAEKKVQLVHFNFAALDHPQLPAMEETVYLKFAVLRAGEG